MSEDREPAFGGAGLPVEVPHARHHDFTSAITGHGYRIFVAIPPVEPPAGGFSVLYLLDGNFAFTTAVYVVGGLLLGGEIRPTVVVGIGYQTVEPAALGARRFEDLATPATPDWIATLLEHAPSGIPGLSVDTGCNVDRFLRVIEEEIKPAVAGLTNINSADQVLMGHSLGGLAVLRALFAAPRSFRSFAAGSPSIWWADGNVLAAEPEFAAEVTTGRAQPSVFIAAGGDEQAVTAAAVRYYGSEARAADVVGLARMVENASELGQRLSLLRGGPGFSVRTVVFAEEGHMSVIPAFISRGVRHSLGVDAGPVEPSRTQLAGT
ncbi:MAG: alpha/beta hydrolase-fold protein [Pseudomonadota bacterium]